MYGLEQHINNDRNKNNNCYLLSLKWMGKNKLNKTNGSRYTSLLQYHYNNIAESSPSQGVVIY